MFQRNQLIDRIFSAAEKEPRVLAMWEQGSAAFDNLDEHSDIDVILLCEDDASAEIIELVQRTLEQLGELDWVADNPVPNWHGSNQRFLHLRDSGPHLIVDVCAIERSKENWFLDRKRHGTPRVIFDRLGLLEGDHSEQEEVANKRAARLKQIAEYHQLHLSCVEKDILRAKPLDAIGFYNALMLRPLVELLGMKHRPWRWDFGLRYLYGELPDAELKRLEKLAYPGSFENLKECFEDAKIWTEQLLAELRS